MTDFLLYRGYMTCCYRVAVAGGGVPVEEVHPAAGEPCGHDPPPGHQSGLCQQQALLCRVPGPHQGCHRSVLIKVVIKNTQVSVN